MSKLTNGELSTFQVKQRFSIIKTLAAVLISLVIAFILLAISCDNPFQALITFITGPFKSFHKFCGMVNKITPLLFTSCAICLIFSTGQINLAVSSAFYLGGVLSILIGSLNGIPTGLHFFLTAGFAGLVGAAVCFIPAIMHTRYNTLMFIASLMFNYVIEYLVRWLLVNPLRDPTTGFEASQKVAESSKLPTLFTSRAVDVHWGLVIALLVVLVTYFIIYKTSYGEKVRIIGNNRKFAEFSGIKSKKIILITCLLGGFIAGFGGATEICGIYGRVTWEICPTYGADGVMITMISHNNPLLVPFAALFMAYIRAGAEMLNISESLPIEIVQIIQSIVISFVAASAFLQGWEHNVITKNAKALVKRAEENSK